MQGRRAQWGHVFPPPSPACCREAVCVLCCSRCCGRRAGTSLNCPDLVCTMGEQLQTACAEGDLSLSRKESLWGTASLTPPTVGGPQAAQTHIAQKGGGACQAPAPVLLPSGDSPPGISYIHDFLKSAPRRQF